MYVLSKITGFVGVANDLPEWVDFDESPPRSMVVYWIGWGAQSMALTNHVVPITKEVFDIMKGVQ